MTATPIPRTVCLTRYGELDISVIDEMPPNRLTSKTYLVLPQKRNAAYDWIKKKIANEKAQVFVVCPFIDRSDIETMQSIKAATDEYEKLRKVFNQNKVGLLHGKMKAKEKESVMTDFYDHKIDLLVSTPVVEVGVDIPDASIIMIEAVERFGLAQLHQLRGRVGRRDKQGFCLLFTERGESNITKRLKIFSQITNGFKLAEYDLHHRGMGQIYGLKQHGDTDYKVASMTDTLLASQASQAASQFINQFRLNDYSLLKEQIIFLRTHQVSRD